MVGGRKKGDGHAFCAAAERLPHSGAPTHRFVACLQDHAHLQRGDDVEHVHHTCGRGCGCVWAWAWVRRHAWVSEGCVCWIGQGQECMHMRKSGEGGGLASATSHKHAPRPHRGKCACTPPSLRPSPPPSLTARQLRLRAWRSDLAIVGGAERDVQRHPERGVGEVKERHGRHPQQALPLVGVDNGQAKYRRPAASSIARAWGAVACGMHGWVCAPYCCAPPPT